MSCTTGMRLYVHCDLIGKKDLVSKGQQHGDHGNNRGYSDTIFVMKCVL